MKTKKPSLSDKELVDKYESGKAPMEKMMKAMLTTPPLSESQAPKKKQRK